MTTATDPLWTLALWIILGAFILACLVLLAGDLRRLDRHLEERRRVRDLDKFRAHVARDMTWTDEALGRVLAALDETDAITNGDRPW
jgi:hypothetical protein